MNHKGSCRTQTFNNMCITVSGLHFSLPASCEKNEGLGTGYNPM